MDIITWVALGVRAVRAVSELIMALRRPRRACGANELLNPKEMADRIGVGLRTLVRWEKDGKIPSVRPSPRKCLFDPVDVIAALKASPR